MKSVFYAILFLLCLAQASHAGTYVQFRTVFGDIGVELLDEEKPATVANFLRYQTNGFYRNLFLHRCVPGFVVQGGEFITLNPGANNLFSEDKVGVWPDFPAVTNEYDVGPRVSNTFGTLAMAREGGVTNSATSQWFFNLADNSGLDLVDGGFTVFGRVVHGTNVLNFFNSLGPFQGVVDMRLCSTNAFFGGLFKELPVRYTGAFCPRVSDLVYVDVSLLRITIEHTAEGHRRVTWTSLAGQVYRVDYTDDFPPDWKTLTRTNGTGSAISVADETADVPRRFYRVRVN